MGRAFNQQVMHAQQACKIKVWGPLNAIPGWDGTHRGRFLPFSCMCTLISYAFKWRTPVAALDVQLAPKLSWTPVKKSCLLWVPGSPSAISSNAQWAILVCQTIPQCYICCGKTASNNAKYRLAEHRSQQNGMLAPGEIGGACVYQPKSFQHHRLNYSIRMKFRVWLRGTSSASWFCKIAGGMAALVSEYTNNLQYLDSLSSQGIS